MTNTPLRDKLVQIEHDVFDAAWLAGTEHVEARYEATLAVKHYEEQALARLALYPGLVIALTRAINEIDYLANTPITAHEVQRGRVMAMELRAVLAKAKLLEEEVADVN